MYLSLYSFDVIITSSTTKIWNLIKPLEYTTNKASVKNWQ